MRLPSTLASFLYLLICRPQYVATSPVPEPEEVQGDLDWIKHLFDRQAPCAGITCGISGVYCCTGGSTCYTDAATVARCGAPTAAAAVTVQSTPGWQYFTTTYTRTDLVTVVSTYSTYLAPVTTVTVPNLAQSTAVCNPASQQGCGAICCDLAVETCAVQGRCMTYGAMTVTPATSTLYSAPLRPTSGTGVTTVTAVITPTTTQTFEMASTAGATAPASSTATLALASANNGLSGGAIAGIVIGVIAGIILLIVICFCCVLKTGFDALLGLFGLGKDRTSRERIEVTEERYSRHGSASGRDRHSGWFGGGGGRSTRVTEKKSSGLAKEGGIVAAILLGLAGLWAILGMKRKSSPKPPASYVSYETYSDSYSGTGTSPSSASSDRRTRETRRTRDTRRSERITSVRGSRA